jgi:hypothetical protein
MARRNSAARITRLVEFLLRVPPARYADDHNTASMPLGEKERWRPGQILGAAFHDADDLGVLLGAMAILYQLVDYLVFGSNGCEGRRTSNVRPTGQL